MITCTNYEGLNHVCKLFSLVLKIRKKWAESVRNRGMIVFSSAAGPRYVIRSPPTRNLCGSGETPRTFININIHLLYYTIQ